MTFGVKQKAVQLRRDGYSYSFISEKLQVGKGTLSSWLSTVSFVPNKHTIETISAAHSKSGQFKNAQKRASILHACNEAEKDIENISTRDLFMLGLGIYIGEGTKTNNQVRMVNSDPKVMKLMVRWFKEICEIQEENFIARIHSYPDIEEKIAIEYWTTTLGFTKLDFHKTYIDQRKNKSQKNFKKLPFGTLHLTIRSNGQKELGVFLARKISAWMALVLK